jgi:hypothetical protein
MRGLAEIEIALQRIAENARSRGDDISYAQRQENNEYIYMLDQALRLVDKVRDSLLQDRARFMPVEQARPRVTGNGPRPKPEEIADTPAFLKQGPRKDHE